LSPKIRYSNEEIIDAAFELVDEGGWAKMTAKNIAKKLNCSVQPLYREFKSLDEIKREVVKRIIEISDEYSKVKHSEIVLISLTLAGVHFAMDHPKLSKATYELEKEYYPDFTKVQEDVFEKICNDPYMKEFSEKEVFYLYLHAFIYSHGLSDLLYMGHLLSYPRENLLHIAQEAIESILEKAKRKHKDDVEEKVLAEVSEST